MRILLSNDDGYQARGLRVLAEKLAQIADVTVVAPDRNRTGASNSLTLETPLRVEQVEPSLYYVNGTPTDCVHLAVTGLLDEEPDMIVSGINHGANLGDDVIYSGTVAAAVEGRFLGLPALAISLVLQSGRHFDTAAAVTRKLIEHMIAEPIPPETIFNVNVPDLPLEELRGYEITRLGYRHKSEPVIKALDPKNQPIYWIGAAGSEQDAGPGTDFHAIANGRVSITPMKIDLTDHKALAPLGDWLHALR
ncbi:MAG TPA: 5'/3'-nucleotidase SurE [Gammaproteobacteria bacterium]|nr:5'/3'-nucleotidase SurE [Gammaproteobacteria bacterium]